MVVIARTTQFFLFLPAKISFFPHHFDRSLLLHPAHRESTADNLSKRAYPASIRVN
jgi:hypothetical protein